MTEQTWPRRVLGTLRAFVHNVFVLPVREGRLRDIHWPVGLRPIVAVALVAYGIGVILVIAGGVIRATSELFAQSTSQVPQPRATVWLLLALVAFSLVLAQTGALHVRAWVRWPVTAYVVMTLLFLGFSQAASTDGWLAVGMTIACSLALVIVVAVRGGRRFAWGDFVGISAIVFVGMAIPVAVSAGQVASGFDFTPLLLTSTMALLSSLAAPATIASGAAVAELAVNSATWVALALRDGLGRIAVAVLIVATLTWRGFDLGPAIVALVDDPGYEIVRIVGAAAFLAALAAGWAGLRRLRRSRALATVSGLIESQLSTSLLIAAAITPLVIITPVILIATVLTTIAPGPVSEGAWALYSVLGSTPVTAGMRLAVGITLVALAVLLARRGVAAMPELFLAIGLASGVGGASVLLGGYQLWTPESVSLVATIACVVLIGWMLAARSVTTARLTAVAVALLAATLFANPQWLTDPLGQVLGSTAIAAVLLGFTWALLTGYPIANRDSRGFPRPSRVLLVLANTVFATTVLAYGALSRDPSSGFDFGLFAELGTITFGTPLVACALLVAFAAFARDRPVDLEAERRIPPVAAEDAVAEPAGAEVAEPAGAEAAGAEAP